MNTEEKQKVIDRAVTAFKSILESQKTISECVEELEKLGGSRQDLMVEIERAK